MQKTAPLVCVLASRRLSVYRAECFDFFRSLNDASIDVITTDPPYSTRCFGFYAWKKETPAWSLSLEREPERFREFLQECRRVLAPDGHLYVMVDSRALLALGPIMRDVFDVKNLIVWDKGRAGLGIHYRRAHELILFATKGKRTVKDRTLTDVWSIPRLHRTAYPTQKPVALFETMLRASADPGTVVCDPFLGSGSAAIAALRSGCAFVGADVSRRACALAARRVRHFIRTGEDPLGSSPQPSRAKG